MTLSSSNLLFLISLAFLLTISRQQCPFGQYLDVNSALANNTHTCSPFTISTDPVYIYTLDNLFIITSLNSSHSFLIFNTSSIITQSPQISVTTYISSFIVSISQTFSSTTSTTIPIPSIPYFKDFIAFYVYSFVDPIVIKLWTFHKTYAQLNLSQLNSAPTITNFTTVCLNSFSSYCKPCPITCLFCFGPDYTSNCLHSIPNL